MVVYVCACVWLCIVVYRCVHVCVSLCMCVYARVCLRMRADGNGWLHMSKHVNV